jgi:O-antigen/teichoic acid export membrane protein
MYARLRRVFSLAGRDYFLYLLPSVLQGVVGLMLVPVTTYFLSPADFGVFALMGAVAIPVRAIAATGARWVLGGNYFQASDGERRTMLFNVLASELALRTTLIMLLAVFAEPILHAAIRDYHNVYLTYFYLTLGAAWAGSLWSAISFLMTLQGRARSFALYSSLQVVVNAITTVIGLTTLKLGVEALFMGALVSGVTSMVFEVLYIRQYVSAHVSGRWMREIVRTGLRATPGGLADLVAGMAEKVLIQRWAGLSALGLYSHSQQYQSIFKMLTAALNNVLTPASLRTYSGRGGADAQERILTYWYGMLGLAGVGVAMLADNAIGFLTHGKFTASAPLVQIWYLIVFSVSHSSPYANFLMARKHNRALMYTQLVPTVLGIGLVAVCTYRYGIYGAAWALVSTSILIQMARRVVAGRLGYRGVAEWQFVEALGIYLVLWMLDGLFQWPLTAELVVAALALPLLILRFGLLTHLRQLMGEDNGDPKKDKENS